MAEKHVSPFDAVKQAIIFLNIPLSEAPDGQRKAINEWQKDFPGLESQLNDPSRLEEAIEGTIPSVDGLAPFLRLVNKIFFAGKLQNVCFDTKRTAEMGGTVGYTESGIDQKPTTIVIDRQHRQMRGDDSVAISVISTLLHECVHAYLVDSACRGLDGNATCKKQGCRFTYNDYARGHSLAWHLLALRVEQKAREWLERDFSLGREAGVDAHYRKSGEVLGEKAIEVCFGEGKRAVKYWDGHREFIEIE